MSKSSRFNIFITVFYFFFVNYFFPLTAFYQNIITLFFKAAIGISLTVAK